MITSEHFIGTRLMEGEVGSFGGPVAPLATGYDAGGTYTPPDATDALLSSYSEATGAYSDQAIKTFMGNGGGGGGKEPTQVYSDRGYVNGPMTSQFNAAAKKYNVNLPFSDNLRIGEYKSVGGRTTLAHNWEDLNRTQYTLSGVSEDGIEALLQPTHSAVSKGHVDVRDKPSEVDPGAITNAQWMGFSLTLLTSIAGFYLSDRQFRLYEKQVKDDLKTGEAQRDLAERGMQIREGRAGGSSGSSTKGSGVNRGKEVSFI